MTTSRVDDRAKLDEIQLVAQLRAGDERAFEATLTQYHTAMIRLACFYVRDRGTAEDVVQETWLAVVRGIERFDGRCSLRTWLYRILTNRAKTTGQRLSRMLPVAIGDQDVHPPAVDPARFLGPDHPQWPGHWSVPPTTWPGDPGGRVEARELMEVVAAAIDRLPSSQATVIALRDVESWSSKEVCNALGLTEANQRVLLHRARSQVRQAVDDYHARSEPR